MSFTDAIFGYFHLNSRSDQFVYMMSGENGKVDHVYMGGEDWKIMRDQGKRRLEVRERENRKYIQVEAE